MASSWLYSSFDFCAVSMALVGYAAPSVGSVILLQALFGVFMGGGSSGLIALAAIYYPTAIRSTGVGWAMGMGRLGSFAGPLAVGSLVAFGLSTTGIFVAIALPALLAVATTAVAGRVKAASAAGSANKVEDPWC